MPESEYPLCEKRGLTICEDHNEAPAGIRSEELRANLSTEEVEQFLDRTGNGITVSFNGIPPRDVERFLRGLPNND